MPVVLHISDLHRTQGPRIENDTLLAAIDSDSKRWALDDIASPDILVVSGDLVQGVPLECDNVEAELDAQYEEAYDFITRLTDRHFDGDRSRVVIVPGNHDVCWPVARAAMEPHAEPVDGLRSKAQLPASDIRWDWGDREVYRIADRHVYGKRLDVFQAFRSRYYESLTTDPLAHDPDLLHVEFPDLGLLVVGFSSSFGNDCFCVVGDIEPRLLAMAQRIVADSDMPTAVAVWHHSIAGGPRRHDYMDDLLMHQLIDAGFVLGLHGHEHRADAAPYELRLPNMSWLCVVSAGSLCVGDSEIPTGHDRQFNLIDIRAADSEVTVHVRQMTAAGLFCPSYRPEFGGKPYLTLRLSESPNSPTPPSQAAILDNASDAIRRGNFAIALDYLGRVGCGLDDASRPLRIAAREGVKDWDGILEVVSDEPRSIDELVLVVKILIDRDDLERAQEVVDATTDFDGPTVEALRERIKIRRAMR